MGFKIERYFFRSIFFKNLKFKIEISIWRILYFLNFNSKNKKIGIIILELKY